jgi:ankyrin repeat protein
MRRARCRVISSESIGPSSRKHLDVVRLLVERGARLDIKDTIYQGTPLGWALYGKQTEIAEYLRGRGAPTA